MEENALEVEARPSRSIPSADDAIEWLAGGEYTHERQGHGLTKTRGEVDELSRGDLLVAALAVTAAVILTWILQMPSSLWIDELGSFWVIDGDLSATASRAWRFQGQTPLYYGLLWAFSQLLGHSEVVLRLPSLLSMLGAAFLLYRFTRRTFTASAALVALVIFIVHPDVRLFAADARPYALALLATIAATILLERLTRKQDPKSAIWYGLAAGAAVYAHYVFSTILLAHLIFFAWVTSRSTGAERRRLWVVSAWAVGVLLAVTGPTIPQAVDLLGRSDELVLSAPGEIPSLIEIWAPPLASVILLCVVLVAASGGRPLRTTPTDPLILLGLGFVVPPLLLLALSQVSDIVLWSPRYWFVVVPYGAMLFGVLISAALRDSRSLKVATFGIVLVGMLMGTSLTHSSEDWRSAASFANSISDSDTEVFLFSGLIELTNPEYLVEPEKKSYVTSPNAYYPFIGQVTPLPWTSFETSDRALTPMEGAIASGAPILVVTNEPRGSPLDFLAGWLSSNGYERTKTEAFGSVRVAAFSP